MVLFCEDEEAAHPFWYVQVIKIFHLSVCHRGSAPQRMDVLWVHWFGLDANAQGGWSKKHLYGISFIPWDEPGTAFGFLDPVQVIREVHLISNFSQGQTNSRLPPLIVCPANDSDEDWESYYVNM